MSPDYDTSVEAEYADGYIHNEAYLGDVSPYRPGANILRDIKDGSPEEEHGPLVRVSCFYGDDWYDIDFTELPEDAVPIRRRHGRMAVNLATGNMESWWRRCDFGYSFLDDNGVTVEEVRTL